MPSKKKKHSPAPVVQAAMMGLALTVLVGAGAELFNLGWGSGHFLGRLSLKWAIALASYVVVAIILFALTYKSIYRPADLKKLQRGFIHLRKSLGNWRWLFVGVVSLFPAYFVFYSPWGGLFTGLFARVAIFTLIIILLTFLLTREKNQLVEIRALLIAGLVLGTAVTLAESLVLVSDYPFALHWSEGNRLWDYSVLFGRERYNYPPDQPIFAWTDPIRQALWGLPFLIPSISIWAVRLWGALLVTVPYALLGWVAFRPLQPAREQWMAAGFWTLIFLNQGPIYTPLILSAILVAVVRRRPIWLALPLVFLAGHYAGVSRFSWRFAPGIWAVILTLGDGVILNGNLTARDWLRAGALGLAGIWTKGLPVLLGIVRGLLPMAQSAPTPITGDPGEGGVETLQGLQATTTHHPFLWYRLFPNEIYPPGIILGLVLVTGALITLFIYLARRGYWKTVPWQRLVTVGGLLAFLAVGVVASAKAGGGTDLHNMDMFLIALVLMAAVAWESGFYKKLAALSRQPTMVRGLLAAIVLIPAFLPMVEGRPLGLPSEERTQFVLQRIQSFVTCARQHGEVLFMDQRQLITFGYMGDLPLVVEYEKKFVMDQALAENASYFEQFHTDLAGGRFSLIVTEREAILYKDESLETIGDSLVEENNAWVRWVTTPLLANYESVGDYKDAAVELFMPIERDFVCP